LIPIKSRSKIETFVFEEIQSLNRLNEIPNLKKLKGFPDYYRVRFGNYRLGVRIEEETIIFERVMHRKDIYRYYP
jgi:mRNA interferase RelE/StbE